MIHDFSRRAPPPGQRDPHWPVVGRLHLLGAEPAAVHHRAGGEEDLLAGFRQGRGGRDLHGGIILGTVRIGAAVRPGRIVITYTRESR